MAALVSIAGENPPASLLAHAVWRADQMGSYQAAVTASGYPELDRELPNAGWPSAALIELLVQQAGIGEMQLLRPALASIARQRRIALVQPPHLPQIAAWTGWGLPAERLLWVKPACSADALWSAEQILRNGSCGVLLLWHSQGRAERERVEPVRAESLRRLHLAAHGSDMVFWMMRPLACAQDASPSPLRLALRPASGGINVRIVKRRGPQCDESMFVTLEGMPAPTSSLSSSRHAYMDRHISTAVAARSNPAELV